VIRVEFGPKGTEPTNEPSRLTSISYLFVFSNFLIPTWYPKCAYNILSRDQQTVPRQMVWLITDANENRWPSRCFWRSQ